MKNIKLFEEFINEKYSKTDKKIRKLLRQVQKKK